MLDGYHLQMTTEELRELYRLAEIGLATELAFNEFNGSIAVNVYNKINIRETILSIENLLKWYKNNS